MSNFKIPLLKSGRTLLIAVIAVLALAGSVFAANGHVFGVKPLTSETVVPPTQLSVSTSVSHRTIFKSRSPRCTAFRYTTSKRTANRITINGKLVAARGWQSAGLHRFEWCVSRHSTLRRGIYTIKVHARTLTESKSSSQTVRLKK
jgi:hypothetical protein